MITNSNTMINSVLFVRPPATGKLETPVAVLYVATAVKKAGYDVEIIDLQAHPQREGEPTERLRSNPSMVLAISALAPHYRWVKRFVRTIRQKCPQTRIIIGGHIASLGTFLLERVGVDYVCTAEGEKILPPLLGALNRGEGLKEIFGLSYMEDGRVVRHPKGKRLSSFDIPDYSLVDMDDYLIHPNRDIFFANSPDYRRRARPDDRLGVIMFSRGCTGYCGFCYRHVPGFCQSTTDWCIEHLKLLHDQYGVRYFRFDDELFTNSQEWLEEFCRRVKEEILDILFRITGLRVDMISPERLALLKGIGCIAINYGIESGSQAILDMMKKGVTAEQGKNAICQTHEAGMQVMAYITLGYRGETEQTLRQTAEMLMHCDLPVQYVSIFYAVALPGTKLYRDMLGSGLIREEEAYLEQLAVYIEESRPARDYYFVNLSSISFTRLIQWEQILLLLLRAVQLWGAESLRTRFVKACVLGLPTGGIFRRSIQFTNRALDKFLRRSPQRRRWK